ncbi:MAG: methyl-accepting chemotaxis protein [Planctomycetes bacterium]|nr:methyl-accepting chemotaxis protein [Planctomycetota bacterium]
MTIRTRLMATLLACGLVPTLGVGFLSYRLSQTSSSELLEHSAAALEKRAGEQMQAVSAARRNDILHYFAAIEAQVISMAKQPHVIDAVAQLAVTIQELGRDLPAAEVEDARRELSRYYQTDFEGEYAKQAGGSRSGIESALQQLDPIAVMAQLQYVQRNPNPLGRKHLLADAKDGSEYTRHHALLHDGLLSVQQAFGYYDLFLIDTEGRVVYSVFKELDFATSLNNGPWARSNLGELARNLQNAPDGKLLFADFAAYKPSYDGPAAFAGTPLLQNGKRVGSLVVQMPIDRINAVVTSTEGMGETGEVTLIGPDLLMRSDSRHNPVTHSVAASFRNPQKGSVDLPAVKEALAGKSASGELVDVDGATEIAYWLPIDVFGVRWAMLAKAEEQEILASLIEMRELAATSGAKMVWWSLGLCLCVAAAMAAFSWFFARQLVTPIQRTVTALKDIADGEGDLRARLDEARGDELGEMGKWFNKFLGKLQVSVRSIAEKANGVSTASSQLTSTAQSLSESAERTKAQTSQVAAAAEEMSSNMSSVSGSSEAMTGTFRTVAAAVEEMTASIAEVAKSAENAARVAGTAAQLTRSSNEKVSALGSAANEIGRVIETIQDIAEQTNLLALNATIEAARAGEAGKGFSVVANEVKDLARQTAEATQDIRQRIERIQASTTESVKAIAEIDQVIAKVSQASQTIATSVAEQRSATQEIASNLAQSTRSIETVANNVREGVAASQDISKSIAEVDQHAQATAAGAEQTSMAGRSMASLAQDLMQVVGSFRT